jgi:hypothetical protein
MIKEFKAFFELFQRGKELTNAAVWKNRQIASNAVAGLLSAGMVIGGGFGMDINIDQQTINVAGAGIVAIVGIANAILTAITSKKVGF